MRRLLAVAALTCLTTPVPGQRGAADSTSGRGAPGILDRALIDPRRDIAFQAAVVPETVYVGQQATYQVGVFLSDEIRARLRRNPEFVPPEVRSMLAFDVPSHSTAMARIVGARRYDVHVFQRALFPLMPGRHPIPSARLNYALPLSNSFFAREESHSERTGAVVLVALDPPQTGRPADYRGAVGRVSVSARVDSRQARVGDPLTFTVSVDGVGNVTLLPRPDLQIAWADVVSGGDRVRLDSSATLLRGHKDFDWIITPRRQGPVSLPPVRYPYFNPYTERYELAVTSPETLQVAPGAVADAERSTVVSLPSLPIRRLYSGEEPVPLSSHAAYWMVIAIAPLPALLLGSLRRPVRRKTPSQERMLRLLVSSTRAIDAAELRRAYAGAIAARVMATPAAMSHHTELVRTLRRAGVSEGTARAAERLLSELDSVVFGRSGGSRLGPNAARRAHEVVTAIHVEARPRQDIAARAARVVTLCLVGVTALGAAMYDPQAAGAFSEGVRQYDAREYDAARRTFFDLTHSRPRSTDAWANFGTASWQSHDTAAAVVGWQRAARLHPTAGDVRQKLALTPGFRDGLLGDIPPVSLSMIGLLGGIAWIAGWGLIALRKRQRRREPAREGAVAIALAVLIALAGLQQKETLEGRRAAVVVTAARLRSTPALGAETGAEMITGEVGRVIGRQGAWSRLRLSDGRAGWVESRRVQVLGVE